MDEGTSALDLETEKKVIKNIETKLNEVTSINVAHRIEAI
jgi:ABC-type bacteriocin/lantibiotic exporter with double-glycine peptidase domain